jgi:class 3 adenylate cyclase
LTLETEGYRVLEAENGRAGLEVAGDESPDLVLCDVNMPEMDGYALVEQLRRIPALASMPFIFLTARGERADVRKGMNLGADDYLVKPITRAELIDAVAVRLKKLDASREALAQQLIVGSELLRRRFRSKLAGEAEQTVLEEVARPGMETSVIEATVLFTDIRGFTTISERLSAVEIAALLNTYFQRACEPIIAAGGRVVKFIGDAALLVFDAERVDRGVEALLGLKAAIDELMVARGWECRLTAKAHFGTAVAGAFGPSRGQHFDVIGKAVNVAAALDGSGVTLSVSAFRKLGPDLRRHFKKHTPPITYIRSEDRRPRHAV